MPAAPALHQVKHRLKNSRKYNYRSILIVDLHSTDVIFYIADREHAGLFLYREIIAQSTVH